MIIVVELHLGYCLTKSLTWSIGATAERANSQSVSVMSVCLAKEWLIDLSSMLAVLS